MSAPKETPSPNDTVRRIAHLVSLGHIGEAKRLLVQAGGAQANDTVCAVMEGQKAEVLSLRKRVDELNNQASEVYRKVRGMTLLEGAEAEDGGIMAMLDEISARSVNRHEECERLRTELAALQTKEAP